MSKVLLIEDSTDIRKLFVRSLIKEGFEVSEATEGKSSIIEAVRQKPDLILLDIIMPGMDGVTALRHLKELPETANIPVVMLTALAEDVPKTMNEPGLLNKALAYWKKDDLIPRELVKRVKEILG